MKRTVQSQFGFLAIALLGFFSATERVAAIEDVAAGRWMTRDPLHYNRTLMFHTGVTRTIRRAANSRTSIAPPADLFGALAHAPTNWTDPSGLDVVDAVNQTTRCEKIWCCLNPRCCQSVRKISTQVQGVLQREFGGGVNHDNTVVNALLHCVGQCMQVGDTLCDCGEIQSLGDAHEDVCLWNSATQPTTIMDLWNNAHGRACGGCSGSAANVGNGSTGVWWDTCLACCKKKAEDCKLHWLPGEEDPCKGLSGDALEWCQSVISDCGGNPPPAP